jgi:hypothetical protein
VRLIITILLVLVFFLLGRVLAGTAGTTLLLSPSSLRSLVFPVAALVGGLLVAGHYVRDIYELPGLSWGLKYILAAVFSIGLPRLRVNKGKKIIKEGEINLIDSIGGPGYVVVSPGSVVLMERLTAPSNVYGAGVHYISRLETLQDTASLEDQHGFIEETAATTRDGIQVLVRDIHYRYRLRPGKKLGDYTQRTPEQPFPYSIRAVRNMAYNRVVLGKGIVAWEDTVKQQVEGLITGYIQSHEIDFLTAPIKAERDPRLEIKERFFSKSARDLFQEVGAELLWVDVGHIDIITEDVDKQRVETWGMKWLGEENVKLKEGEAVRLAAQELGRVDGQVRILKEITLAMKELDIENNPRSLRSLIMMRTAQLLDALPEQEDQIESKPPELPDRHSSPSEDLIDSGEQGEI